MNTHKQKIIENKNNYLNEKLLGEYLYYIFGEDKVVHNKKVPDSGIMKRPDYRIDEHMLIFEFDGNRHFQQTHMIHTDRFKDYVYESMGYTVVRIPYFLQMHKEVIVSLFGDYVDLDDLDIDEIASNYQHGFIDAKAVLPCDYSCEGYAVFHQHLNFIERTINPSIASEIAFLNPLERGNEVGSLVSVVGFDSRSVFWKYVFMISGLDLFGEDTQDFLDNHISETVKKELMFFKSATPIESIFMMEFDDPSEYMKLIQNVKPKDHEKLLSVIGLVE